MGARCSALLSMMIQVQYNNTEKCVLPYTWDYVSYFVVVVAVAVAVAITVVVAIVVDDVLVFVLVALAVPIVLAVLVVPLVIYLNISIRVLLVVVVVVVVGLALCLIFERYLQHGKFKFQLFVVLVVFAPFWTSNRSSSRFCSILKGICIILDFEILTSASFCIIFAALRNSIVLLFLHLWYLQHI